MEYRKLIFSLLISLNLILVSLVSGFTQIGATRRCTCNHLSRGLPSIHNELHAKPKRLEENVDGVLYVNDKVRIF